jgi:hypothetical protein
MGTDENDIIEFLKKFDSFVSATEIAKRVGGKRRFTEDRDWARPILYRMLMEGLVEANEYAHYRIMPESRKKKNNRETSHQYSVGCKTYILDDDQPFALVLAAFRAA